MEEPKLLFLNGGTAAQAFKIVYNSAGDTYKYYTITSMTDTGPTKTVSKDSSTNNICQKPVNTSNDQWKIYYSTGGYYYINSYSQPDMRMAVNDNNNGSVSGTSVNSPGNVFLATAATTNKQEWKFVCIDDDGLVDLSNMIAYQQETPDTCSSAAIRMTLYHYNIYKIEEEITNKQKSISPEWAFMHAIRDTLNYYLTGYGVQYTNISTSTYGTKYYCILKSLLAGNPVIVTINPKPSGWVYPPGDSTGHWIVISAIQIDSSGNYLLYFYD